MVTLLPTRSLFTPGATPAAGRSLAGSILALALLWGGVSSAQAMTPEERDELDLSEYSVTDPNASYFDVEARMSLIAETRNSLLLQHQEELEKDAPSCRQLLQLPTITHNVRIPGFYPTPDEWELATEPLFRFEDSVAELAGTFVATGDPYYAECLVKFLDNWAQDDALTTFHYHWSQPQAWFSLESMIFAAAMAYSTVRPQVEGLAEERERVEAWLHRVGRNHMAIEGSETSCCNNHFYRRALYATMVGIILEDNDMFRYGVSAIYSALHDMTEEGAFLLEVARGRRAVHYQNYALVYLIPIMELIARQGYGIYDLEVNGNTIHEAVDFAMDIMEDPSELGDLAPSEQYLGFLKDNQYFNWMEIYRARFGESRFDDFLRTMRPVYNRGAGGYVTLYYMDPEAQEHIEKDEEERKSTAFEGLAAN